MIAQALFYYLFQSWKNRLMVRLRRLRQPKYLFGGIAGGAYIWFAFIWPQMAQYRRARQTVGIPEEFGMIVEATAAFVLLLFLISAWVFPHERASLTFTEAEVAFLFPAPISRKTLIHFKLLKSQLGILFSALIFSFIGKSFGGGATFLTRALGWWVVLSIINLHIMGSSFTMTMLMDRGISNFKRRLFVMGSAALVLAGVLVWGWTTFPTARLEEMTDINAITSYLRHVLESGPLPYLLYPFRLMVRPYLAKTPWDSLMALGPALVIMVAHYLWVTRSDVAFEEASIDASRKLAEKISAMRAGNWQQAGQNIKARREPFTLKPRGMPAVAIIWKNLISAGSIFRGRVMLLLSIYIITLGATLGVTMGQRHGLGMAISVVALILTGLSLVIGPGVMRQDLRQDLLITDILKQYPISGRQLVFGEVMTPVVLLTAVQWLLLLTIAILWPVRLGNFHLELGMRIAICLGAAIIFPAINCLGVTIPNTAVLIFPAWFQHGKDAARGIETMGQQMILLFGQLFVLILSLIPASLLFTVFLFVGKFVAGVEIGIVVGSIVAAGILGVEIWLGLIQLGKRFEAFDLSAELTERS